MPTYMIEGKKVRTEAPLTEEQIDEIGADIRAQGGSTAPVASAAPKEDQGMSLKDVAVGGLTQGLRTLGTIGSYLDIGGSGVDPAERVARTEQEMKAIEQATGADVAKTEGVLGAALKAPFDPTTYMFAPLKGATGALNVLQSMGGAAGAEAASQATGGSVVGSMLGGFLGASSIGTAPTLVKGAQTAIRQKDQIPEIIQNLSDKNTQDFVKQIISSDDKFKDRLVGAESVLDTVSKFANEADIQQFKTASPFFYEALTNPAGRAFFEKAARGDPAMQGILRKELENIQKLREAAPERFGFKGDIPNVPLKTEFEDKLSARIKEQEAKITAINNNLSRKLGGDDKQQLGLELQNAIAVKESLARAKLDKRYEALKKANVSVNKDVINAMIEGYSPKEQAEMFRSLDPITRKAVQALSLKDSLNAEDVIELKNALMKAGRTTTDGAQLAEVNALKQRFNELRKSLPEGFNNRLLKIDQQYNEDVALPFVRDISVQGAKSSDFASDAIKNISQKPESVDSLREALGTTKADSFMRKAMYANAYDAAFDPKTGKINPAKLKSFVFKNRQVLNKIPDLRVKLEGDASNLTSFQKELDNIELERKQYIDTFANGYFSAVSGGDVNVEKVVSGMLGSQGKFTTERVAKDLAKRLTTEDANVVRTALKEEMVRRVTAPGANVSQGLKDNKEAFREVFGEQGFNELQKLGQFFDKEKAITRILEKAGASSIETDAIKGLTGVETTYLFSQFRDRISSVPQKAARILTKSYQAGIQERTARAIEDFLTSPESVKKVNEILARETSGKLPFQEFAEEFTKVFANHWRNAGVVSAKQGVQQGTQEDQSAKQRQELMRLIGG